MKLGKTVGSHKATKTQRNPTLIELVAFFKMVFNRNQKIMFYLVIFVALCDI
jgi:hypothetical protein